LCGESDFGSLSRGQHQYLNDTFSIHLLRVAGHTHRGRKFGHRFCNQIGRTQMNAEWIYHHNFHGYGSILHECSTFCCGQRLLSLDLEFQAAALADNYHGAGWNGKRRGMIDTSARYAPN
jgi:hypothetical protein